MAETGPSMAERQQSKIEQAVQYIQGINARNPYEVPEVIVSATTIQRLAEGISIPVSEDIETSTPLDAITAFRNVINEGADQSTIIKAAQTVVKAQQEHPLPLPLRVISQQIRKDDEGNETIWIQVRTAALADIAWTAQMEGDETAFTSEQPIKTGDRGKEEGRAWISFPRPAQDGLLRMNIKGDYYNGLCVSEEPANFVIKGDKIAQQWNNNIQNPVSREPATIADGYDPEGIRKTWHEIAKTNKGIMIVEDLDENEFDTASYWVHYTNVFLANNGVDLNRLPTIDEVMQAGGPSTYYRVNFADVWPGDTYDKEFAEELRYRPRGNWRGKKMHEDLAGLLEYTAQRENITFLGGLTARPASREVVNATRKQLEINGMDPNKPIIYRPVDKPLSESSQIKLDLLEKMAQETEGTVAIIDDSISTAKKIEAYNKQYIADHEGKKSNLIQIVNITGVLTAPRIGRHPENGSFEVPVELREDGMYYENPEHGIFFMNGWDDLDTVLNRIEAWRQSQN